MVRGRGGRATALTGNSAVLGADRACLSAGAAAPAEHAAALRSARSSGALFGIAALRRTACELRSRGHRRVRLELREYAEHSSRGHGVRVADCLLKSWADARGTGRQWRIF